MSTPDLSSPAAVAAFLRQYNTWRRDESELDAPDRPKMPAPADLGRVIDAAVRMLEGRPAGDVPAVMRVAADRIDELERLARNEQVRSKIRPEFDADTPKKFNRGDRVRKKSGSKWQGVVVGEYSTELNPEGYAVESESHAGSVQIYPASALELIQRAEAGG